MIVRIQYFTNGTGDVKLSPNELFVVPNHFTFQELLLEITRVSCFCLSYFETRCTLQVCTFIKVYQLVHHVLK